MKRPTIGLFLIGAALVLMFSFAVIVQQQMNEGTSLGEALATNWALLLLPLGLWMVGAWMYRTGMRQSEDGDDAE